MSSSREGHPHPVTDSHLSIYPIAWTNNQQPDFYSQAYPIQHFYASTRVSNPVFTETEKPGNPGFFKTEKPGFGCL